MDIKTFFTQYPVFTGQEFAQFVIEKPSASKRAAEALLAYHLSVGHIIRIRRNLYAVTATYNPLVGALVTPYMIGMKLASDAILGYHTALAFQGKVYSLSNQFQILTSRRSTQVQYDAYEFQLVQAPKALRTSNQYLFGVKTHFGQHHIPFQVTNLERTLVDVLDRPELGGGWEEIWRSLESIDYFDIDQIISYALLLGKANTISLVGFYLEQHQEQLQVKEHHLKTLEQHRPKQPFYLERIPNQPIQFNSRWNLIIPLKIIQRAWEAQ